MPKLTLVAEPTFKAKVAIPVAGLSGPVEIIFEFKHRTKSDLAKWMEGAKDRLDIDSVMGTVVGWGFDDEFSRDNVQLLLENHHGASRAIASKYLSELMALRLGN